MNTQLLIDKHLLDMIYSDDIREDYADMVIEDLIEEIEDMESGEPKDIVDSGTIDNVELGG